MLQCFHRKVAGRRVGFSRFLLSIILLFLLRSPAESACVDDVLERVDRDTLLMDSQGLYRVLDSRGVAVFWLPLSKVTICDPLDSSGDEDTVIYEIRNHDDNQVVQAMRER